MGNRVYTYISIKGADAGKTKQVYTMLKKWIDEESDGFKAFDRVRIEIGIRQKSAGSHIGGELSYVKYNDNNDSIFVKTETKDSPKLEIWKMFVNKFLPGAELKYCAECQGYRPVVRKEDATISGFNDEAWTFCGNDIEFCDSILFLDTYILDT